MSNNIFNNSEIRKKLRTINWDFAEDNTTYLSHDIHPYPAKYIPQIPHHLIEILSHQGDLIWDPFGGSGTTAFESILSKRRVISTDINPISTVIGRAKTTTFTRDMENEMANFIKVIDRLNKKSNLIDFI
ncbi:DNA adenine methylase, partial [Enterococcus faecium]|nr:DNA adenine methylase [Enterococcus faecium]